MELVQVIAYSGVFVFAITGALKARKHRMDIFGAAVLAFVTAYGGGTIRDLLLGIRPVSWVNDYIALSLVIGAVMIVSLVRRSSIKFIRTIFITDAIGLGLFTSTGIEIALHNDINSAYAVVMGVITGTFGGLLADILSNTIPDLLKRGELYATASLIGGLIYILFLKAGIPHNVDQLVCVVVVVAVRIISKVKRLVLPDI
ncbi:MAG TPA: trimeric intracellular cation channel family protein [Parafilimonas sp.]|nr:trimeric intracellular cation channel family protein [Parafilimonas sp.]